MNDIYLVNDTYNLNSQNRISSFFDYKTYDKNEIGCFCYVLESSWGMYDLTAIDGISDEIFDKINNKRNFYLVLSSMTDSNIKNHISFWQVRYLSIRVV